MAYSINAKDYFKTKLYVGNSNAGSPNTQSITGLDFQPDFTWCKNRDAGSNHALFDSVRGVTKLINSNTTTAEATVADTLTAFDTNGFTLGTDVTQGVVNNINQNFVGWSWKAGGAGVANTAGSINSTVSVNTTSGFSIVKYVGNASQSQTVGHGLGVAPKLIIFKSSTSADDWSICCPSVLGVDGRLTLNTDAGNAIGDNTFWNSVAPSSTLFSIGNNPRANASGQTIIAYCFADVQGFSKSGSYIGDGNSRFTYTGFKPAFVLGKQLAGGSDWWLFDSARSPSNIANKLVYPNANSADATNAVLDLLSNGFKMKTSAAQFNGNGTTYLYMAFAEAPLVSTNGVPATAR
jgi:hypothetical protein